MDLMRNFAIIDDNNIVDNIVVSKEAEAVQLVFGSTRKIVEEFESTGVPFIGATYRPDVNKFVPFKLYDSWTFDEDTWQWVAPVSRPEDGKNYYWSEPTLAWVELAEENS